MAKLTFMTLPFWRQSGCSVILTLQKLAGINTFAARPGCGNVEVVNTDSFENLGSPAVLCVAYSSLVIAVTLGAFFSGRSFSDGLYRVPFSTSSALFFVVSFFDFSTTV